ncbi:hypothetical protein dsx2_0386 [Desulfovibrio sp. X2]|uniref:hypothetical protein n=1 Tax=Desulfovibrio sp. X2 TaxID=941449 RepID=UPI000358A119|nr:hypothetical protein [Desulfovibrio sp. X2]EPR39812.1 hypothetical protein dsx2_0386 [Desulfovibrio sp. X2]
MRVSKAYFLTFSIMALLGAALVFSAAALPGTARAAGPAMGQTAWSGGDFASGVGGEWSVSETLKVGKTTILGPFNYRNDSVPSAATLTLENLTPGKYRLRFDLYLIGSWDSAGSDKADTFDVLDGADRTLLHMTEFPCRIEGTNESKPIGNAGLVRTPLSQRELGYWVVPVSLDIEPGSFADGKLRLRFVGHPTARRVESWGLADVRLEPR